MGYHSMGYLRFDCSILIFIPGAGSELPKDSSLQHDTTSLRARWSSTNLHFQTKPTTELASALSIVTPFQHNANFEKIVIIDRYD